MVLRVRAAVAGLAAVCALAACSGGGTVPQSGSARSIAEHTRPSEKLIGPGPTNREVAGIAGFVSPSGNIGCMITADQSRCDIMDRDWTPPAKPADCELDFGQGISLVPGARAQFVCAGDTAFGADEVLPYGESISAGVLRCESAQSWITCRDVQTGHGFSISREAYRLF